MNLTWVKAMKLFDNDRRVSLFVGEPEDVPNRRFGPILPNCQELARKTCEFVGYILPFDPETYRDKSKIRDRLGYGKEPLVVCSIGGTSVGKELLELCGQAYLVARRAVPDLRMVMVCGPRLAPELVAAPDGVEIKAYVPSLFEHFAACDLAVVQGGGTTTLELTALRRPFLYFPLEEHSEQQIHVAGRLARHGAGIKMLYSQQNPQTLADRIVSSLDQDVTCSHIDTDGAQKVARIVASLT
jgi:predicted glycosyltransferase